MKKKIIYPVFVFLFLTVTAKGQSANNAKSALTDSLENKAFALLTAYIAADTQDIKLSEAEANYISHAGEQHYLYVPIARGSTPEPTENASWDKSLPTVYNKEATQGSPFLLFLYVPGLVISDSYTVYPTSAYRFNYDKMTGNLVARKGNQMAFAVNRETVKLFCLKKDKGGVIFMRVPSINNNEFFQVLYKGAKYSCFKLYKSKFTYADQATNGYIAAGKDYDEFEDIVTYYLLDEKQQTPHVFELRKKSIKTVFGPLDPTIAQYFNKHKYEEVTETFVANLTEALNK